jgi:hypothetical protein
MTVGRLSLRRQTTNLRLVTANKQELPLPMDLEARVSDSEFSRYLGHCAKSLQ